MKIEVIHEHSVAVDLLTGGVCIDVGCRGFQFSEAMRDFGCEVHAYDIEPMFPAPKGIRFGHVAVLNYNGWAKYTDTKDPQAKFISDTGIDVECRDINEIIELMYDEIGKNIDVVKIDAEGSEYFILPHLFAREMPRQLSIEFHMHAHRALHDQYYDKCMENLLKYYVPVKHELTAAHGAGWNFWDSLFVRKDLMP